MAVKFKYEPITEEVVEKSASQTGGDYDSYLNDNVKFLKVAEGENTYRVLPRTWKDTAAWGSNWNIIIWVHRNVGPNNDVYLCPAKHKDEPCPICEAVADMDSDEDEKEIIKLKVKQERLAYVIDRAAPKEGVKVWRFGWKLEKKLALRSRNKKTGEVIQISDPDEGYDITFRRDGKGLNTEYVGEDVDRESSPMSTKQSQYDAWLEFVVENPLPDQLIFHDYDYIDKVYRGKGKKKADEDEDSKPTRKGKAKTVEEDDDEEDQPKSKRIKPDVDEDDVKPSRKRAVVEDDEDDKSKKPVGKKKKLPKVDPVMLAKMDDEELTTLVEEYNLDVETEGVKIVKLRREVTEALEAGNMLETGIDDEIPSKGSSRAHAKNGKDEEEEDEDDDEDGESGTIAQAKKSIERLRPGKR